MCLLPFTLHSLPFVDCTAHHSHRSAALQATSALFGSHHNPKIVSPYAYTLQARARRGHQSFLSIGSGWNLYYSSWAGSLLPIQPAASALGHLYSTMLVNSQTIWLEKPSAGNGFTVAFNNIILVFSCKERPIGWDFVESFSRRLLALTQEGWTGCYRLMLSHAESGVTVEVNLSVAEDGYNDLDW